MRGHAGEAGLGSRPHPRASGMRRALAGLPRATANHRRDPGVAWEVSVCAGAGLGAAGANASRWRRREAACGEPGPDSGRRLSAEGQTHPPALQAAPGGPRLGPGSEPAPQACPPASRLRPAPAQAPPPEAHRPRPRPPAARPPPPSARLRSGGGRSRKPGADGGVDREAAALSPAARTRPSPAAGARAARAGMAAAAEPRARAWLGGSSPRPGSPASSPELGGRGRARPGPGSGSGSGSGPERAGARTPGPAASGHSFRKVTLTKPTFCHLCSDFIWGLAGFLCDGERPRPHHRPQPLAQNGSSSPALLAVASSGQPLAPRGRSVLASDPLQGGDKDWLFQGLGGTRWLPRTMGLRKNPLPGLPHLGRDSMGGEHCGLHGAGAVTG